MELALTSNDLETHLSAAVKDQAALAFLLHTKRNDIKAYLREVHEPGPLSVAMFYATYEIQPCLFE